MSTRGRKAELQVIEGGLKSEDVSEFPDSIPETLQDEWRAVIKDLSDRKMLTDAVLPTVESYVLAIGNMRTAQQAIRDHGALITGRDGVLKQNPAISLLGKCNTAIQRISAELGLTPASRSKSKMRGDEEDHGQSGHLGDLFDV